MYSKKKLLSFPLLKFFSFLSTMDGISKLDVKDIVKTKTQSKKNKQI